ncbi:MAG: gfo/Idh/MocA family oxidoreductase, partial [Verrucomicrobia bacterium]|nr:gfo/Idh/MocA family oxidoreductase [Verrucomicrobiota bacterium]
MNKHDNSNKLTRRRFLTRSALAASAVALPCYTPASTLGRGGALAPSERIVMGAIGLGGRGSSDLDWMLGQSDVRFVAVCDVRKGSREGARNAVNNKYGNK